MSEPQLHSALSLDEWQTLDFDLFEEAGGYLAHLRAYARSNLLPPVPFVIAGCLRVLSSLPGNATFDAGVGEGSLNLFVALVGSPGQGKDRLISAVNRAVTVTAKGHPLEPQELALGSGEGVAEALQPDEHHTISHPVLFGVSEVGEAAALMRRTGSTLRGNLLKIYSGNALGFTNRGEKFTVGAHTYTAGLWVGVQPDKAGDLLDGQDDGLRHRFIWTEVIDPNLLNLDNEQLARRGGGSECAELPRVEVPEEIIDGAPMSFHEDIVRETRRMMVTNLAFGVQGPNSGHRHQTRLKLAAGLALLRCAGTVSLDDWERAGVLMRYSDRVQDRCLAYLQRKREQEVAKRFEEKERADEQVRTNRVARFRYKVLTMLEDGDVSTRTAILQSVRSDQRPVMVEVLASLEREGLICTEEGERNQTFVRRNPNHTDPWE